MTALPRYSVLRGGDDGDRVVIVDHGRHGIVVAELDPDALSTVEEMNELAERFAAGANRPVIAEAARYFASLEPPEDLKPDWAGYAVFFSSGGFLGAVAGILARIEGWI